MANACVTASHADTQQGQTPCYHWAALCPMGLDRGIWTKTHARRGAGMRVFWDRRGHGGQRAQPPRVGGFTFLCQNLRAMPVSPWNAPPRGRTIVRTGGGANTPSRGFWGFLSVIYPRSTDTHLRKTRNFRRLNFNLYIPPLHRWVKLFLLFLPLSYGFCYPLLYEGIQVLLL